MTDYIEQSEYTYGPGHKFPISDDETSGSSNDTDLSANQVLSGESEEYSPNPRKTKGFKNDDPIPPVWGRLRVKVMI